MQSTRDKKNTHKSKTLLLNYKKLNLVPTLIIYQKLNHKTKTKQLCARDLARHRKKKVDLFKIKQ